MSAQINLYHPRYLKQREWLALGPVTALALAVYLLLAVAAGLTWRDASERQAVAAATAAQLKATKAQVVETTQAVAVRKPSAQLLTEAENAEAVLRRRESILRLLEGGAIGTTAGFSGHFRALARQAPEGLWLTGFSIAAGGGDICIAGSTLRAATVPDYIARLAREKAFQGRSFAALTMQRASVPATPGCAATGAAAASPPALTLAALAGAAGPAPAAAAASAGPHPIDFVLLPKVGPAELKP